MSPRPMPSPVLRRSERQKRREQQLRQQYRWHTWALLGLIIGVVLLEYVLFDGQQQATIGKSVALGAGLNWLTQALFLYIALGLPKSNNGTQMVRWLYVGQGVKWTITLVGFAMIFKWISPISTGAVLFGFAAMQMVHLIGVTKLRYR